MLDCLVITKILECVTNALAYQSKIIRKSYTSFIGLGPDPENVKLIIITNLYYAK